MDKRCSAPRMGLVDSTRSLPSSPCSRSQYRLVVMGSAGVGKTSIITRFLYQEFATEHTATVEEMHRGEYEVAGMPLTLDILDTSGSFPFPAMRKLSMSTGNAFILVYSVLDRSSFEEVKSLRQQIISERGEEDQAPPIVVVGNKTEVADDEREVARCEAEETALRVWGHGYIETSALEDVNIAGVFKELLNQADIHVAEHALKISKLRRSASSKGSSKECSEKTKLRKQDSCVVS